MYERSNPFFEYFAGGLLDMSECSYEQIDERSTRVTGQRYVPVTGKTTVKIEGSAWLGDKYIGIAGIRDPYTIANIDAVLDLVRGEVASEFSTAEYHLNFRVYGKDGVMGDLEPVKSITSHELCVVVEAIAQGAELAESVALMASRQIFYARLPEVKGTAGTAAFIVDEVLPATPAYQWSINHTVTVDDPMELFDLHLIDVGTSA